MEVKIKLPNFSSVKESVENNKFLKAVSAAKKTFEDESGLSDAKGKAKAKLANTLRSAADRLSQNETVKVEEAKVEPVKEQAPVEEGFMDKVITAGGKLKNIWRKI